MTAPITFRITDVMTTQDGTHIAFCRSELSQMVATLCTSARMEKGADLVASLDHITGTWRFVSAPTPAFYPDAQGHAPQP